MASRLSSPTVRRRRLGAELKTLRIAAGLNRDQAAEHLGVAPSTITKVENATSAARPADVAMLLEFYGVDEERREFLITLAREARQRGWWQDHKKAIRPWFETFVGLESAAIELRPYDSELIPGLLQTADYYRAHLSTTPIRLSAEETEQKVAFRLARQEQLAAPDGLRLWSITNEACIRRMVGGTTTMKAQLRHLIAAAERPNITLQILPFAAGSHPAMDGSFVIIEFPERTSPDVVYLESQTDARYLEEADVVDRYNVVFNHLRAKALDPGESLRLLVQAEKDL
ncbi:helix-turn-helix transcriptional regulator [Nonomuraea sp. NPDC026600]|uniref:helix-turn-helix domain-containing protein n=1 Tax=Nonomuraea sp. NPDC026600 TaxID=3155363 RepID=UPI003406D51B